MKLLAIILVAASVPACASGGRTECRPMTSVPSTAETAPRAAAPSRSATTPSGAMYAIAAATSDKPVHPEIVHDDASVKIVVVTIAAGQTMKEHATPVPVTVQTISGAGMMKVSGEDHPLTTDKVHFLDAEAPHAIRADAGAPLVLLVHYLK